VAVLVACETLLLVLLVLLVAGLLRSHAEILRRLGPPPEEGEGARVPEVSTHQAVETGPLPEPATRVAGEPAADIAGTTLDGDAVKVALEGAAPATLLAFLSSGCATCRSLWGELAGGVPTAPGGPVRLIAVVKDTTEESPSRLRELAPAAARVVMSSAAWEAYRVPAAPYFAYVTGGVVAGEGSATSLTQIGSLLRDAGEDERVARRRGGDGRVERADSALAASGIGPGHPSLYPGGAPSGE
jgi:hypothetical protein